MIVTPGQLTQRSDFYHQLNQLTAAGIGLLPALEQLKRGSRSYHYPISRVLEQLARGYTLAEALEHGGKWLPEFDIALIQAGEKSGRLDGCFKMLADYYSERARIAYQLIAALAYPVFLFHFFAFIIYFPQFFQTGDWVKYLVQILTTLFPAYAIAAVVIFASQSSHAERWRALLERVLNPVPVLGTARRSMALSRLAAALEALISAGMTIIEAWDLAARASGSPALRRTVAGWRPLLNAGQTPAEVLATSSTFPELFAHQYATGEISGKLDDSLRRLHTYYHEESIRKTRTLARWIPLVIYLFIVFRIAMYVIHFYTGYFQQIRDATSF